MAVRRLLIAVAPLVGAQALGCLGVRSCSPRAPRFRLLGSRAQALQLWCTGLDAPQHVGSFQTGDRTRVSCICKWILYH